MTEKMPTTKPPTRSSAVYHISSQGAIALIHERSITGLHPAAHDALELTVRISRSRGEDNPPRSRVPLAKLHAPVIALHVPRRHHAGSVVNAG
jgi:hypothetical protein